MDQEQLWRSLRLLSLSRTILTIIIGEVVVIVIAEVVIIIIIAIMAAEVIIIEVTAEVQLQPMPIQEPVRRT